MLDLSRFGLTALALLWLASCTPPVQAEEREMSVGRGFLCDTAEEVAAVATPDEGEIAARVESVNRRFGRDACTFASSVFVGGEEAQSVPTPKGLARIEKVKLIGYLVGNALQVADRAEQYFGIILGGRRGGDSSASR